DSAPHPVAKKLAVSGIPGIFNAPVALAVYAKVFEEENALDKLEAFAALNGAKHYGLAANEATITLEKRPWRVPEEIKVNGPDERALIHHGGETLQWQAGAWPRPPPAPPPPAPPHAAPRPPLPRAAPGRRGLPPPPLA